MIDMVQHRSVEADAHYTRLHPEPIEVAESWELDHHRACVLKYIARAPHKHNYELDMLKAAWYALRATGRKVRISDLYALGESNGND